MPRELQLILLLSIFNPAAIGVGFILGRNADEAQKTVVAAFVAGLAGTAFAWALMLLGLTSAGSRLLAGIFIMSGLVGWLSAVIGFRLGPGR